MTAKASVEFGRAQQLAGYTSINGGCVAQEELAVAAGVTNTTTATATSAYQADGVCVVRVATDDTACYVAVGTTPDPTLTVATIASSARRLLPAGAAIELPVTRDQKVAVRGQ